MPQPIAVPALCEANNGNYANGACAMQHQKAEQIASTGQRPNPHMLKLGAEMRCCRLMPSRSLSPAAARSRKETRPVCSLIDTVGAGDSFMAPMMAWLKDNIINLRYDIATQDQTALEAILQRAAHAAALTCQRQGCNPPDLQNLQRDGKP